MKKYWEKFFELTVYENRIDSVNKLLSDLDDVMSFEYKVFDVDGEKIAHYCMLLNGGRKTFNRIVRKLNKN